MISSYEEPVRNYRFFFYLKRLSPPSVVKTFPCLHKIITKEVYIKGIAGLISPLSKKKKWEIKKDIVSYNINT